MVKSFVLKIGGHLLDDNLEEYAEILKEILSKYKDLNIHTVIGGGKKARDYIEIGRKIGIDEASLDYIGILISQINAYLFYQYLSKYIEINYVKNFEEIVNAINSNKKIICGGLFPSISTTTVACIIAEVSRSELLYATNVEGIYDKDPNKFKDAKFYKEIHIDQLLEFFAKKEDYKAGEYKLFDILSLQIIKRSRIPVRVFNGKKKENLLKVFENENIGTKIIS